MKKRLQKKIEKQKILQSYNLNPRDARKKYKEDRLELNQIKQSESNYLQSILDKAHALREQSNQALLKALSIIDDISDRGLRQSIIKRLSTYDLLLKDCLELNHTIDSLNKCLDAVDETLEKYDIISYTKGRLLGAKKICEYLSIDVQKRILEITYQTFRENILDGNASPIGIATLVGLKIEELLHDAIDQYHEEMTEGIRQEIDKASHYVQGNSSGYWTADDE